jgi:hypothetical protein
MAYHRQMGTSRGRAYNIEITIIMMIAPAFSSRKSQGRLLLTSKPQRGMTYILNNFALFEYGNKKSEPKG